ncbi:hypothetical protein EC968_007546, partial [Mortierella alpina]
DLQVKIRGFRIEVGEIETPLREHPLVSEVAVAPLGEGSNMRLVAYVIMNAIEDNRAQAISILRSHLTTKLPEYMVPTAFVRLDAFPLTPNGKLDRRALPAPGSNDYARQEYESPRGEVERTLASIWLDLLQIEKVSRHDSIFALGGHSLMAPQGSRAALFCVHPVAGLGWGFAALLTHLHWDQPLYSLQARGFNGDDGMASTMDEMALDYIAQIRRIQPNGPYHLLGYSTGGVIAHTMASHLEKQGERVALLALMDTPADYHTEQRHLSDELEKKLMKAVTVGLESDQYPFDLINPFLERVRVIIKNNMRIVGAQAPRLIHGDVLIFHATVLDKEDPKPLSPHDWKPYIRGNIEVCEIECLHEDMGSPEPMALIAQALNERLK